jgi:TRAP-type C4-dicarboxylate transport system substrate-binding protein
MFSSLSADNIQAALFTSFGLLQICPAAMTLSVPFRIKDDAEMELVFKEVLPILDAQISKTKFAVVTWSRGGWVNIFSKDPILTLDDLRRQKIATQPEAEEMNTVFKTMGFHMVETEITDIVPRMANNIVTACYQTPAAIAPMGLHKTLKNMLSKPLAPFLGAIVINRVTWNKISPERQRDIMRVTQSIAAEFDALMPKMVDNAVTVMSRDGLRVNDLSPEQEALWNTELQKAIPLLLGTTYDRDLYNKIGGILEKARSRQ